MGKKGEKKRAQEEGENNDMKQIALASRCVETVQYFMALYTHL